MIANELTQSDHKESPYCKCPFSCDFVSKVGRADKAYQTKIKNSNFFKLIFKFILRNILCFT